MAKRIQRKLTDRLKKKLKEDYNKVKLSDFGDDALKYLKRVRATAKARKAKQDKEFIVGETKIPKDSDLYKLISAAAKENKQSVKRYTKTHKEDIDKLVEKGKIFIVREGDYLFEDIKKSKAVYIKGKRVSKSQAQLNVQELQTDLMTRGKTYHVIFIEHSYDLKGNLYLDIPSLEDLQKNTGKDDLRYFIDKKYPNIKYIPNDDEGEDEESEDEN